MNLSLLFTGLFLMIIGFLFTAITLGFGIICSWPLFIIGFIMIVLGIISPSPSRMKKTDDQSGYHTNTKRICPNCAKTMPMNAQYCPHCGGKNKFS